MILAISNQNEKLIRELCAKYDYDEIDVYTGIKDLKDFAIRELQNLSNFKYLILDITNLKEKEEMIVKSVVAIKSMHNIRIIIYGAGYKEGDSILAKLFNEGIYNFIIGDTYQKQDVEFEKCLVGDGNSYKDSIRFRVEETNKKGKDKIIVKKEYKKLKQLLTVGIAGTESHIGVSTQALVLCRFFNERGLNACYISSSSKDIIGNMKLLTEEKKDKEVFEYQGVDMYSNSNNIDAIKYGYDVYIYDYGILNDNNLDMFIKNDKRIIIGGTKLWELKNLFLTINKLESLEDVYYILNNCPANEKNTMLSNMGKYKKKTYFSDVISNPFEVGKNGDIYQEIFKDNLEEKHSQLVTKERKNIFNIFRSFKNEK